MRELARSAQMVEFYHFDFALQTLAKLERGHAQDLRDAEDFVRGGFVTAAVLRRSFDEIEPQLVRYPAIDVPGFKRKVEERLGRMSGA
jgi:hypothetical protein